MSWLAKVSHKISQRSDLTLRGSPTGGAGSGLPGIVTFPGQGQIFVEPIKPQKRRNKKQRR